LSRRGKHDALCAALRAGGAAVGNVEAVAWAGFVIKGAVLGRVLLEETDHDVEQDDGSNDAALKVRSNAETNGHGEDEHLLKGSPRH